MVVTGGVVGVGAAGARCSGCTLLGIGTSVGVVDAVGAGEKRGTYWNLRNTRDQ